MVSLNHLVDTNVVDCPSPSEMVPRDGRIMPTSLLGATQQLHLVRIGIDFKAIPKGLMCNA